MSIAQMPQSNRFRMEEQPYRIMVVDDSAVIRGLFTRILEDDPEIKVIASVGDGQMALNALKRHDPPIEVATLDIEMPNMDGMTALPRMRDVDPDLQILMASTLTKANAEVTMRALNSGAADYVTKPSSRSDIHSSEEFRRELVTKVKGLAAARRRKAGVKYKPAMNNRVEQPRATSSTVARPSAPLETRKSRAPSSSAATRRAPAAPLANRLAQKEVVLRQAGRERPDVLAIGSSTGGPQALFQLLGDLKNNVMKVPILITQHMPATFTTILAEHIARASGMASAEAQDHEPIVSGRIYVAPGNFHMTVAKEGDKRVIRLLQTPPENFCRPAVDPMLRSLTEIYGGRKILTVILTGMGQDGLKGAKLVVDGGGTVIAQDEATSVVWGMPGAVATAGLCSAVAPIQEIGAWVKRQTLGGAV